MSHGSRGVPGLGLRGLGPVVILLGTLLVGGSACAGADPTHARSPRTRIKGYVDTGFFVPSGAGTGFVLDAAGAHTARFPGAAAVFLGDPLTTAVNSRGEPADAGVLPILPTDAIRSGGNSSFIFNELNLDIFGELTDEASLVTSVDLIPRRGGGGDTGDVLDVDFGYLHWRPTADPELVVQAGKIPPVFGREWRVQESPDRTEVTPSLIHRYLGGHPVGVRGRRRFLGPRDHVWSVSLALANGNSHVEQFLPSDEIDSNSGKTVSGRLARRAEKLGGVGRVEVGLSAERGAPSGNSGGAGKQWQAGADLWVERGDLELTAEYVRGVSPGAAQGSILSLVFEGYFVLVIYRLTNVVTPYLRWESHTATATSARIALLSDSRRLTGGLRLELAPGWLFKGEYVINLERGPVPAITNDTATTSLVLTF